MTSRIDVFADICCPFTHVGLRRVIPRLAGIDDHIEVVVRAWPLEWVNGSPMEAAAAAVKVQALRAQLGTELFTGFDPDTWPPTTIPALNLAAAAYARDLAVGLEASLAMRRELFERGRDVSDSAVLGSLADRWGLPHPIREPSEALVQDYEEGRRRGVTGSPHFFTDTDDYFCPSLDVGRDETDHLSVAFDDSGLDRFLSRLAVDL